MDEPALAVFQVTKDLYPRVAELCNSTSSRVERAIRHAIHVSSINGDLETIKKVHGYTMNSDKGRPTNSEFIANVADYISLEEMEG